MPKMGVGQVFSTCHIAGQEALRYPMNIFIGPLKSLHNCHSGGVKRPENVTWQQDATLTLEQAPTLHSE